MGHVKVSKTGNILGPSSVPAKLEATVMKFLVLRVERPGKVGSLLFRPHRMTTAASWA